jgi:hypothetical protein
MSIHIPLTPIVLFVLLAILVILWVIFTLIIRYHWKNFGTSELDFIGMNLFYLVGSGVLILGMVFSAFLFSFSAL